MEKIQVLKRKKLIYYKGEKFEFVRGGAIELPKPTSGREGPETYHRTAAWAILERTTSGRRIFVMNAHTPTRKGSSTNDRVNIAWHLRREIEENSDGLPVVLLGDFNQRYDGDIINSLTWLGFLKNNSGITDEKLSSTNDFFAPISTSDVIDYIFVSRKDGVWGDDDYLPTKNFQLIYDRYKGKYPSDHFPLMASVDLGSKGTIQRGPSMGMTNIKVGPNPTNSSSFVHGAMDKEYLLTDLSGRIIKRGNINSNYFELELNGYDSGVYQLIIENEVFRLVKTN